MIIDEEQREKIPKKLKEINKFKSQIDFEEQEPLLDIDEFKFQIKALKLEG